MCRAPKTPSPQETHSAGVGAGLRPAQVSFQVAGSDLGGTAESGPEERSYFPARELNLGSLDENQES